MNTLCHACNKVYNTAKDSVKMPDLVEVCNARAAHSPMERLGDHFGDQTNCFVKNKHQNRSGAQQKRTQYLIEPPSNIFNIISHGEHILQQVRTRQNFWVMAHKSLLIKHQGMIQHIPLMDWTKEE